MLQSFQIRYGFAVWLMYDIFAFRFRIILCKATNIYSTILNYEIQILNHFYLDSGLFQNFLVFGKYVNMRGVN